MEEKKIEEKVQTEEKYRQPKITVAVGAKGIGKTKTTLDIIESYVKGDECTGRKGRKVVILDVNNEFLQFKTISTRHIVLFAQQPRPEVRRVSCFKRNGQTKNFDDLYQDINTILTDFRGGMVLIEDISTFVADNIRRDLFGKICTIRHKNADMVLHFQGIGSFANKKIMRNTNFLRMHKTFDSVSEYPDLKEHYAILKIAEGIVNNDFNKAISKDPDVDKSDLMGFQHKDGTYKSTYVYVNFDTYKICGDFTKEQFYDACYNYIMENESLTISPLLKQKVVQTGKAKFTYQEAFTECIKNFYYRLYDGQ